MRVLGELRREEFQRRIPPQARVLGLVDHPHPANTQLLEDDVVGDGLAGSELPCSWGAGLATVARRPGLGSSGGQPVDCPARRTDELLRRIELGPLDHVSAVWTDRCASQPVHAREWRIARFSRAAGHGSIENQSPVASTVLAAGVSPRALRSLPSQEVPRKMPVDPLVVFLEGIVAETPQGLTVILGRARAGDEQRGESSSPSSTTSCAGSPLG